MPSFLDDVDWERVRRIGGRLLAIAGAGAAAFSAVAIGLLMLALLALQFGPVRAAIGARVIALLGEGDGLTIEIEDYRGIWPVTFGAGEIVVRDAGEVIARVGDVNFSWAPMDLLTGTVHVTALEVARVDVLALPASSDDADPSPPGPLIPSLPVAIKIDRLALPQIDLAAGIAGDEAVRLGVEGHAALSGGRADIALKALRHDTGNFDLDAVLAYAPDEGILAFDIKLVDGAPGAPGLVAALAGDDALGVLRVEAHGDGPVDAWRGTGDIAAGRYGSLTFLADGDRRGGGALNIEAQFAPGPAAGDLPAQMTLVTQASWQDDTYTLEGMKLAAGDASFDGRLVVEDPLAAAHVMLEGSLKNAGTLAGDLALPPEMALALDVTGDEALSQFDVAQLEVTLARLSAPGQVLAFEGAIDLERGVVSGDAQVDVDDVAPLARLADIDAAGPLTARLDITRATFAGAVDASLVARFQPVALPDDRLAPLIGADLNVHARVADAGDGTTRIEQFDLMPASGAFAMTASGLVSPDMADLEIDLTAAQLAPFSAIAGTPLAGAGQVLLHLSGPMDALTADAELTFTDAQVAGIAVTGQAQAQVKLAPALSGPVTFKGSIAGSQADISLVIDSNDGATRVRDIAATLLDMKITGGLALGQSGGMSAQLDARVSSLAALGRVAGTPMSGAGDFTVKSVPGDTGNRLVVEGTLRRVEVAGVQAGNLTLRGGLGPDEQVSGRIQLRTVRVAHVSAGAAQINISGTLQRLAIALDAQQLDTFEDTRGSGSLALKAVYDAQASQVEVSELTGKLVGIPIALKAPTTISFSDGLDVAPLALGIGRGVIEASFARKAARMNADVVVQTLPLRFLAAAAGESSIVRGDLTGKAGLSTNGTTGTGTADFTASPQVAGEADDIPDIRFTANWDGSTAQTSITSDAPGTDDLSITAGLPLRARGGMPEIPDGAALDARMAGNLDVGAFWPLVPVDGHRMLGVLAMDVSARGPLENLEVSGTASMQDGLYENFDTGILLSPLDLELDASTSGGTLTVTARDGADGTMKGSGSLDLSDGADERLDVSLKLTSFRIAQRDEVHSTASGDITVLWPRWPGGSAQPVTIGGQITVEKVDAVIPDQLPSDVTTIDVTRVTGEGEPLQPVARVEKEKDASANQPSGIELDLAIDVPRQAFVRGRGLDSEWMGNVVVSGTANDPSVRGSFQVVRGTFDFLGQTFDLTGGRIEFTGGREIDPYLDVKAVYEDDGFQAVVSVSGLASDPAIELSSEPLLPQDEILARILFGTGTGQLSAFQAVQLAQAAATLTGFSGGGGGVLGIMRRSLGVDVLSVGESGLEVGSYVRDGVYVGVSQGLEAGSGQVSVEVELTDDISVESEVGATGDTNVGVSWERDY